MKVGESIGDNYRLVKVLGKGGMGEVWLADDVRLGRKVAIKFFIADFDDREKAQQRFLREARVMARLRNPHVVTIFEFGFPDVGSPFLVMEFVAGETLFDRLARDQRLDPNTSVHVTRQMCLALDEAHAAGIVHRDLKPENVLLSTLAGDPWYVKVVDFGLARSYAEEEGPEEERNDLRRLTTAAVILGTPAYMSPEQALGRELSPKSDLYSLGIILYQMLTGHLPIHAQTAQEFLVSHQVQRPKPLIEMEGCEQLPPRLNEVVMGLLEKRPEVRAETAASVSAELQRILSQIGRGDVASGTMAIGSRGSTADAPAAEAPSSDPDALKPMQTMLSKQAFEAGSSFLAQRRLVLKKLLGRDAELEVLLEQFRQVIERNVPRVVAVHGPPGVGVSRLLLQFMPLAHKHANKGRFLRLLPWEGIADSPGRPFVDLLMRSAGVRPTDTASRIRARFRDAFRRIARSGGLGGVGDSDSLARRGAESLALMLGTAPTGGDVNAPEAVFNDCLEFGARLLSGTFADVPTVILIDNAEQLRPAARTMLGAWLDRIKPARWLVLLGVHGDEVPAIGPPGCKVCARPMRLDPLSRGAMEELATAYEQGLGDDSGSLKDLVRRAGGMPGRLHGAALVRLLGQPVQQYAKESTTPEAEVLRLAGVCGNIFPVELLDHMARRPTQDVLELWGRQGVITRMEVHELGGTPGYAFVSPQFYRPFRGAMRPQMRAAAHAQALEWLEDQTPGEAMTLSSRRLSHQVGRANLEGTLSAAEVMSVHGMRVGAVAEAAQSSNRVLSALQSRASRKRLSVEEFGMLERAALQVANVRESLLGREAAREVLQSVELLARKYADPEYRLCHARILGGVARLAGDADERRELIERGINTLGEDSDLTAESASAAADLYLALAEYEREAGHASSAHRALKRAAEVASLGAVPSAGLRATFEMADLAVSTGDHSSAVELLKRVAEEAHDGADTALEGRALLRLGTIHGRLAEMESAKPYIDRARSLYEKNSDRRGVISAGIVEAEALLARPDFWGARRLLETLDLDPDRMPGLAARKLELLSEVMLATGEADKAKSMGQKAQELSERAGDRVTGARARLLVFRARVEQGDSGPDVNRGLVELVRLQKDLNDAEGLGRTYAFTAIEAAQGRIPSLRSGAKGIFEQALKMLRQAGSLAEAKRLEDRQRRLGF